MNLQLELIFATTAGDRRTFRIDGYTSATLPDAATIRQAMQAMAESNPIDRHHHDFARPLTYRVVAVAHAPR